MLERQLPPKAVPVSEKNSSCRQYPFCRKLYLDASFPEKRCDVSAPGSHLLKLFPDRLVELLVGRFAEFSPLVYLNLVPVALGVPLPYESKTGVNHQPLVSRVDRVVISDAQTIMC